MKEKVESEAMPYALQHILDTMAIAWAYGLIRKQIKTSSQKTSRRQIASSQNKKRRQDEY